MSNIGEIIHGKDLGKTQTYYQGIKKYIYVKCPSCDKERWVALRPTTKSGISRCKSCCGKETNSSGYLPHGKMEKASNWKGGRSDTLSRKYIYIRIYDDNPFFCMAVHAKRGGGEILEHRLIMARYLNRVLTPQEHVHHKNGDKKDNRLENLELISQNNHFLYNVMCSHCNVRKENRYLKERIKELESQLPQLFTSKK